MTYVSKHARFTVLDGIPADVWQESAPEEATNERAPIITDPDKYLCIVGEEAYDYDGSFAACVYSRALYRRDHVGVSYEYLRDSCTLAPEETARKIIAHYLRGWAESFAVYGFELVTDSAGIVHDCYSVNHTITAPSGEKFARVDYFDRETIAQVFPKEA